MSAPYDDTAADPPVRDVTTHLSTPAAAPQDSAQQSARARHDVSRVSREELEDRYLRVHEETLLLKQHINKQDDKIRKLGTKLMRLVKDRGRLEQLAVGGGQQVSRVRDVEMEEMMEELQDKVRVLQVENEGLKQRLLVAKQQLVTSSRRPSPYGHVQPRVNSGLKRLRDDAPSPTRPKSTRSLEGGARPPTGLLPRFGHNLLEEARAEIRNLENVVELQRSHMEEMEAAAELLQEQLRRKEDEHEEKLLQLRQQQTSKLRSHVSSNVTMIKLQKQLADRSNAVTELEGRFLQLQESQRTLKASYDAAMMKVDELTAQLKDERLKSLELEKRLQSSSIGRRKLEQLQERIREVEHERDLLKENNEKLLSSAFDVSQQQKWQIQEQQLKLQIVQLETALKADLVDKNQILDKIKAERETSERLEEENQKLQIEFLEQKQQLEELNGRLRFYSRESEYDMAELTEALLLIKTRNAQKNGGLGFLKEAQEEQEAASSLQELRAAHTETIQELHKTRNLLSMESKICQDYKAELDAVLKKTSVDKVEYEQKLERQAQLLDGRAAKIRKLEAQLRDVAYGTKAYVFKPDTADEDDGVDEAQLERGENVVELQVVGAALSPAALEALGDGEPSTFCTYSFYLFEPHSTPVVTGRTPKYGFTSKYVVSVDERFLDYLHRSSVTVELHQAQGLDWRTVASGRLRLQQLLQQDGRIHGSVPLVSTGDEVRSFGSVDYWLRLRIPMTETLHLYRERVAAEGYVHTQPPPSGSSDWNQLHITVQQCRGLRSGSRQPSPYVVYKFSDFPDYPTATVHDCCDPVFNDLKSYTVYMDTDLDRYLRSGLLQFYVFDYKEEQMDAYMGKARVPLLPLVQDQVSGVFELNDPCGRPAGHIQVMLRWSLTYHPPPAMTAEASPEEEEEEQEEEEEEEDTDLPHQSTSQPELAASKAPLPELRPKTQVKDGLVAKRVSFMDPRDTKTQQVSQPHLSDPTGEESLLFPSLHQEAPSCSRVAQLEDAASGGSPMTSSLDVQPQAVREEEEEEKDEEEESHFSAGQLVAAGSQSCSDDSDVTEDIVPDEAAEDRTEQSDSDDCIVERAAAARKPSDRVRVEVLSLSLRPESRVTRDSSVVRLFVEYSLLDLPTEETPLSLPKPPRGKTINFNYSKVFPVDAKNNMARRRLLRGVLQGRNPDMERIRFTVVSEPPEEEEQEKECEDVGVAFLRIPEILERRQDLTETSLDVMDVDRDTELVGSLTVSVEGLEALQAIMEDQDQDQDQDQRQTTVSS